MVETTNRSSALSDLMPCSNVYSYALEDELILFDAPTKQLYRINPTAAIIWEGYCAGISPKETIAALSDATGVAAEQISEDVNDITSQWHAMGLFHNNRSQVIERQPDNTDQSIDPYDYNGPVPKLSSNNNNYKFRIIDTCFQLSVPTEYELQLVEPILTHLSVPDEAAYDEHLYIEHADNRYLLVHNQKVIDWCMHTNGITPMLHGNSLLIAYELSQCIFGLHAAAVHYREKCVLMPALSGSGKSTLTAALVGSGFTLCADDIVLLTQPPVRMRPVPVVIGLKNGSWPLLAKYHTDIESLPIHLRADDKHVRYLAPPADAMMSMESQPLPIDYIVFPKFTDDINSSILIKLSSAEGLCRLADAGYDVHDEMTQTSIKQLVDWITGIPCFEMPFNKLDNAVSTILSLVT